MESVRDRQTKPMSEGVPQLLQGNQCKRLKYRFSPSAMKRKKTMRSLCGCAEVGKCARMRSKHAFLIYTCNPF